MDKAGGMILRKMNSKLARIAAFQYLCKIVGDKAGKLVVGNLDGVIPPFVVNYRSHRPNDFGVVVNIGDMIQVWNPWTEKITKYMAPDFKKRLIGDNDGTRQGE
jgi:hypothetical protein